MTLHLPRAAALLVALPLLLTSCSDDGGTTTQPSTSQPPSSVSSTPGVRTVTPAAALALVAGGAVVLDVRTAEEYAAGHLRQARNLSVADDFRTAVAALSRAGSYVVYCHSGNRSAQAAAVMKELGFTDVADAGGLDALAAAGGDVVT
jgi:rhodanese-related sulfurtransferase